MSLTYLIKLLAFNPCSGESHIESQVFLHSRKEKGATHIGKEADSCLRHSEHRVFCSYVKHSISCESHTSSHYDSVKKIYLWRRLQS
jgi:hypothetical protein